MKRKEKDSSTVVIPELTGYVGTAGAPIVQWTIALRRP